MNKHRPVLSTNLTHSQLGSTILKERHPTIAPTVTLINPLRENFEVPLFTVEPSIVVQIGATD